MILAAYPDAACKPRLRGIPDVVAVVAFLPAVLRLIERTQHSPHARAYTMYGVCLLAMFTVSALYHAVRWPLRVLAVWMRVDHTMIYAMIAGSYMPLCAVGLPAQVGGPLAKFMWTLAAFGAGKTLVWPLAPRVVTTTLYVLMGIVIVPFTPMMLRQVNPLATWLVLAGGALYITGACVYARRWPNPNPRNFGYHEIFHVFIIAAAVCHFVCVSLLASGL